MDDQVTAVLIDYMQKLVIANWGVGEKGKSSSVKNVFALLSEKFPSIVLINNGDIKAMVQIGEVLVGIESQGDPKSRQGESLRNFQKMGCDIIVCASRSYGETCENIKDLKNHGYQVVWTQNDRTDDETMHDYLNRRYAERVVEMIEDRIEGENGF